MEIANDDKIPTIEKFEETFGHFYIAN